MLGSIYLSFIKFDPFAKGAVHSNYRLSQPVKNPFHTGFKSVKRSESVLSEFMDFSVHCLSSVAILYVH